MGKALGRNSGPPLQIAEPRFNRIPSALARTAKLVDAWPWPVRSLFFTHEEMSANTILQGIYQVVAWPLPQCPLLLASIGPLNPQRDSIANSASGSSAWWGWAAQSESACSLGAA
jgi:hypothetical protein